MTGNTSSRRNDSFLGGIETKSGTIGSQKFPAILSPKDRIFARTCVEVELEASIAKALCIVDRIRFAAWIEVRQPITPCRQRHFA